MADQRPKDAAFLPQAWQPGLQRLAKSFSREKLAPLARVSDTLSDVKRNGEHLMLTAQSQVAKLNENTARLAGDLSVLASRGEGRPSRLGGLRKSSSEANLQRAGHGSSRSARQSSRLGSGWPIPRRRTTHASDAEALKVGMSVWDGVGTGHGVYGAGPTGVGVPGASSHVMTGHLPLRHRQAIAWGV
ncbi:hypothetical protein APUTEX25_005057 [Auxenochlorella protothecoides]|uniref:Uncharacterized protein n=1 Tax=Auxenochlorella protothecoides TaxID=3075 RepID=A0A3M7L4Q1_AUXPR|nr:hypothetical protein APUTEX25_005057 [Auxenochlorella protothecoides]|eukprot:RMZ56995.1 hypothetical protein APUTEX25_005057 [Auxenochlorella protothecoides]